MTARNPRAPALLSAVLWLATALLGPLHAIGHAGVAPDARASRAIASAAASGIARAAERPGAERGAASEATCAAHAAVDEVAACEVCAALALSQAASPGEHAAPARGPVLSQPCPLPLVAALAPPLLGSASIRGPPAAL